MINVRSTCRYLPSAGAPRCKGVVLNKYTLYIYILPLWCLQTFLNGVYRHFSFSNLTAISRLPTVTLGQLKRTDQSNSQSLLGSCETSDYDFN